MLNKRLISAAAGAAFLATALVGCSEAEDAVNDAKDQASEAGEAAVEDGKEKASDAAESALDGATGADGEGDSEGEGEGAAAEGSANVEVDLGEFSEDPAAVAVGDYYTERQAALTSGDTANVEELTTSDHFDRVSTYIENHEGEEGPFTVVVKAVEGSTVQVCAGPEGSNPRALTVEDGKVADGQKGSAEC